MKKKKLFSKILAIVSVLCLVMYTYNLSNDKVNILDERVINETRNVTGVATNRFNQSYSVDEDENPLCFDRNGVLFDN